MPAKSYNVDTTQRHTFRLDYRMTVSFLLDQGGQVDGDYPIYILESTDGSYYRKLSAGSDLAAAGDYMHLLFDKLLPGLNYKLTRLLEEDFQEVIFDDIPLATIVDQSRDIHDVLEDHGYAELDLDGGSAADVICWQPAPDDDSSLTRLA